MRGLQSCISCSFANREEWEVRITPPILVICKLQPLDPARCLVSLHLLQTTHLRIHQWTIKPTQTHSRVHHHPVATIAAPAHLTLLPMTTDNLPNPTNLPSHMPLNWHVLHTQAIPCPAKAHRCQAHSNSITHSSNHIPLSPNSMLSYSFTLKPPVFALSLLVLISSFGSIFIYFRTLSLI